MGLNIVVLIKQVPDTRNVAGEVMKKDGTMNRSALPAIFNPDDLHALEMALEVRQTYGGTVTAISMGPLQAAAVLRDALYRGADQVVLLSDRKFAGADTQATSYSLAEGIKKLGDFDLIFCGRQAIDGDTAQVGPQVAHKLGVPQITYAEQIISLEDGVLVARRALAGGAEIVQCEMPCLLTVVSTANTPRPPSARRRITYKLAAIPSEIPQLVEDWPEFGDQKTLEEYLSEHNLHIPVWTAEDLDLEPDSIGLKGSPTQVHKVNFVVLEATESKEIPATPEGIKALIEELIKEYVVG
jgi:electron transfer flavoprotein beta subunit